LEKAGKIVIASGDESYCHAAHHADYSYLLVGPGNKTIHEVFCAVRDGLRVCIQGFVTRWGPIAIDGKDDCEFSNAARTLDVNGARFKELNQEGNIRQIYLAGAEGAVSKMGKHELCHKAVHMGLYTSYEQADLISKKALYAAVMVEKKIQDKAADARSVGRIKNTQEKAKELMITDWEEKFTDYSDCALTTIRFMIAYAHAGDYHDNFDFLMFFKYMVCVYHTYPEWCKQQQAKMDAGTLYPPTQHPFYTWNNPEDHSLGGHPARALKTFIDNAPYHHGGTANIKSWSKTFIAEILLLKGITSISVPHRTNPTEEPPMRYEVPDVSKGEDWPRGSPNVEEVRLGAIEELKVKCPDVLKEPWMLLLRKAQESWGGEPLEHDGEFLAWWSNHFTAPYTPTFWAVELMWAFSKNFVALAQNQDPRRTPSGVIKLLRERMCNPGEQFKDVWEKDFLHCEAQMNLWIKLHHEQNNGPLSGTVDEPVGMPTAEEYEMWKIWGGMGSPTVHEDEFVGAEAPFIDNNEMRQDGAENIDPLL
jgi:hypothetical protein